MCNLKVGPICFLCAAIFPIINEFDLRSVNGGVDCATCTIVLGLVEKLSIVYNENIINSLEQLCNALPTDFPAYGKVTIEYLDVIILDEFLNKETSDVICHTLELCRDCLGQKIC
ncbi:unnamed protein product [Adineta ricciae]|uniref:Saposin B-type domain-containing protein n=1 Tax=Adineta ricciae TaxID=249248 RepID=A0A815C7S0_ADIRI|nr:unnamed protein product [Adineta ricciae]